MDTLDKLCRLPIGYLVIDKNTGETIRVETIEQVNIVVIENHTYTIRGIYHE